MEIYFIDLYTMFNKNSSHKIKHVNALLMVCLTAFLGGLDLMIVPGLAFTKRGHRLGGGKGYYDVYVQNCSHDPHGRPYTIGLAFKEQILHSIPTDVHDFMVDEVIYPDN